MCSTERWSHARKRAVSYGEKTGLNGDIAGIYLWQPTAALEDIVVYGDYMRTNYL